METRTFRIVPVQQASEVEEVNLLKEKAVRKDPPFCCKYETDDDDDDVSSLSLRSTDEEEPRNSRNNNIDIEFRDDDTSLSTVLGPYSRKYLLSKKQNLPISETQKRIAQLQSAGLSISTKSISHYSISKRDFQSSRYQKEERQDPPTTISKPMSFGSKTSSALQALLEKDSRKTQQMVATPPPPHRPAHFHRDQYSSSTRKKSTPLTSLKNIKTEESLDPIIVARPSYRGMRVPRKDYPDPVLFGWTFIGSCGESQVEFFEKALNGSGQKMVVVLEFHYTTGTFKVTLRHNGEESLLAFCLGSLAPRIYRKVLLDPIGCFNVKGETTEKLPVLV